MSFPSGYTQGAAVAQVQLRTNTGFGSPTNANVVALLNAAIEQVQLKTEAILTNGFTPITVPSTTTIVLPADVGRLRNVAYATGDITVPGTSAYALELVPYDQYLMVVQAVPVGSIGGIASIATVVQDTSNQMTLQVYPLVSSGRIYYWYYQRATLWDPANPNSVTTLDSAFQEPVILWTCARVMESQENDNRAQIFDQQYRVALEEAKADVFKRTRKNQSNIVQDVSAGASIWPAWTRG